MDNLSTPTQAAPLDGRIELNRDAVLALNETRKWAMFISIFMFVVCGFLLLASVAIGAVMSAMANSRAMPFPPYVLTLIYLVLAGFYFVMYLYLFKFASSMRKALVERSNDVTAEAFRSLKNHFKITGILMITMIAGYILVIVLVIAVGAGGLMGNSVNA